MRITTGLSTWSRGLRERWRGLHRPRMGLSGPTMRGLTASGTVARCWYCGLPATVGSECVRNPYASSAMRYPHFVKEDILDEGYYVGVS